MENLAFIYSALAYEDVDTDLHLRSLDELGSHISSSPILGIMGAAIAVSVMAQSPANATLVPGNSCAAVGTAQAALQAQGYSVGEIDDIYGNNTQSAVEQFQSNYGLSPDGIIGPATASALGLDPNISCGSNSGSGSGGNGSAYVNTNGDPLDVRSGPGTDYDVIGSLPNGTSVSIVSQQGNWGELPTGGWVSLSWITSGNGSSNSGGGGSDNGSAYVNTNGDPLNVRSGPGTSYDVISSIPDGTSVSIVNQQGNWGELSNGGWVSLSWISGL